MKKSKHEVHYSTGTPAEHCGNCRHFVRAHDECKRVEGTIMARYWCTIWSPKEWTGAADHRKAA
jgi:hypothetical protein